MYTCLATILMNIFILYKRLKIGILMSLIETYLIDDLSDIIDVVLFECRGEMLFIFTLDI